MSRKRSVPEPSFSFGVNVLRLNQTFDHLDNEEDRASNEINDIDWEDTSNLLFHNIQDTMSDLDELTVYFKSCYLETFSYHVFSSSFTLVVLFNTSLTTMFLYGRPPSTFIHVLPWEQI